LEALLALGDRLLSQAAVDPQASVADKQTAHTSSLRHLGEAIPEVMHSEL
jgi:hypothetical protein